MKYTCEIEIDLPREKVVELFDNPDNLTKWMTGLKRFEHISGVTGQAGAESRLVFEHNGKEMEMIETVTQNHLPDNMSGKYDMKGIKNFIHNYFKDYGDKTVWISENEFIFSGFFMKLFSPFMRGSFKKQSLKFMVNFKNFAEGK